MVAFATDDDGQLRRVGALGRLELLERLPDQRHFVAHDDVELALGARVSITRPKTKAINILQKRHRGKRGFDSAAFCSSPGTL